MQNRFIKKLITVSVIFPSLVVSTLGGSGLLLSGPALVHATNGTYCSTITLTSGTTTDTAGYTETTQTEGTALSAGNYTPGAFAPATITQAVIPPWVDPATNSNFSTSSAVWISTNATWPGGAGNTEGSATSSQWRLFRDDFTLPAGATVNSANIVFSADNAASVYLNGTGLPIATTNSTSSEDVFGVTPVSGPQNFAQTFSSSFSPTAGANTLEFVVRNWSAEATENPTGLLYKATINYCAPVTPPEEDVTVTIAKYLDGSLATAESASSTAFPMHATYPGGEGDFNLSPTGFNNATPYMATTADMDSGSDYSVYEVTNDIASSSAILPMGAACSAGAYQLMGYKMSEVSLAHAASSTMQTSTPSFTDLESDGYVIVMNALCPTNPGNGSSTGTGDLGGEVIQDNGVLHVDSVTVLKATSTANGTFTDGWKYVFRITDPTNEPKLAMKFANWINGANSSTIPVANNMRISSPQADNAGATVLLTAANVYSSPALNMVTDLDPGVSGRQVDVLVEVSIPVGTAAGSYTTNYGVQTNP